MRRNKYKKIKLAAAVLAILAVGLAFFLRKKEDVWRVLGFVPPGIVRETIDTPTYYILRQTHEPFLRSDDLQNYTSRIFKKWERSIDYRTFVFYPDTGLKFNKEDVLTKEIFDEQISSATVKYGRPFNMESSPESVRITFDSSQKQYLYFLTWYENAPALRRGSLEYGLGKFYISSYDPGKIVMTRKSPVRNGYNIIEYYDFAGDGDARLEDRRIQDFNLLPAGQRPAWIKTDYAVVRNPEPRSAVLLINHPDREVRKRLYNCMDVSEFRKAFFGGDNGFYDISTVLPVGISGAKPGLPEQNCEAGPAVIPGKISLVNLRSDNVKTLPEYLEILRKNTGISVTENKVDYSGIVKLINDPQRKPYSYGLFQIYLDTFRPDHKVFFEYTSGKRSFLDFHVPQAEKLFSELLQAEDFSRQTDLAGRLADILAEEAMVLPLYQTYSEVYYPREIKNIALGKGFWQYPEIADLKW